MPEYFSLSPPTDRGGLKGFSVVDTLKRFPPKPKDAGGRAEADKGWGGGWPSQPRRHRRVLEQGWNAPAAPFSPT